jgi:hypothetical protein
MSGRRSRQRAAFIIRRQITPWTLWSLFMGRKMIRYVRTMIRYVFGHKKGAGRTTQLVIMSLVVLAATIASAVFFVLAGSDAEHRPAWLIRGAVALAIPVLVTAGREIMAARAGERLAQAGELLGNQIDDATALLTVAMSNYLNPCMVYLGQMARTTDTGKRQTLMGKIEQAVVNAAAHLCGPPGQDVRAVYFKAEAGTMAQAAFSGSSQPSARTFRDEVNDPAGKAAWAWAKSGAVKLFENISSEPPALFAPSQTNTYQTFLTSGVVVEEHIYGMLNVDAPFSGDLGESDLAIAAVLSRVLAVGNAILGA